MSRNRSRQLWLDIHKWLGLGLGLIIAFIGLTGSWNVYYLWLDEQINDDLWRVAPPDREVSLDEIAGIAAPHCRGSETLSMELPRRETVAFAVYCVTGGREKLIAIDPGSRAAAVIGTRWEDASLRHIMYDLHAELLLGKPGKWFVGAMSLVLIVSTATGIVLWWPKFRYWKESFLIRRTVRGPRLWRKLHEVFGIYSAVVLLISSLTGIYLAFPEPTVAAVSAFSPVSFSVYETPESPRRKEGAATDEVMGPQQALDKVRRQFPGAHFAEVKIPVSTDEPYLIVFRQPSELRDHNGDSVAWIDRHSGEIVKSFDSMSDSTAGDAFLHSLFPLHNGQAFGAVGRGLTFVAGLVPSLLIVTGLVMWSRKRRYRKPSGRQPLSP